MKKICISDEKNKKNAISELMNLSGLPPTSDFRVLSWTRKSGVESFFAYR